MYKLSGEIDEFSSKSFEIKNCLTSGHKKEQ